MDELLECQGIPMLDSTVCSLSFAWGYAAARDRLQEYADMGDSWIRVGGLVDDAHNRQGYIARSWRQRAK
jgi:hypothetical protein